MFEIASSRCAPRVSAEGSLNEAPSADGADGAGEGVAGAFAGAIVGCVGAAGAAGVATVAGAGVDGAFDVDVEVAGAALGF